MRTAVIPGEIIASGDDYLPGEGTEKRGKNIVALRYGLSEEVNKLVKIIPLSGVYHPRRGNVVIGKVENITFNGWVIDIGTYQSAFLPLSEVPKLGLPDPKNLPFSIKILLESALRNFDNYQITEADIRRIAGWSAMSAMVRANFIILW